MLANQPSKGPDFQPEVKKLTLHAIWWLTKFTFPRLNASRNLSKTKMLRKRTNIKKY